MVSGQVANGVTEFAISGGPLLKGGYRRGWIIGEAPKVQKEPLAHFPMKGRLTVRGALLGEKGKISFKTSLRSYIIVDRYTLRQLDMEGIGSKSAPRPATVDAYWINFSTTTGYTLVYFHDVQMHDTVALFDGKALTGWKQPTFEGEHVYNGIRPR